MGRGAGAWARQVLLGVALAAFVVACLRLGWWQLQRFQSPGGSWQNLGYTLQWPTFAIFALVAVWRLRKLERQRQAEQAGSSGPAQPPPSSPPIPRPAPIDHGDEPDDELAAYNRMLAELNRKDGGTCDARRAWPDRPGAGVPQDKEQDRGRH